MRSFKRFGDSSPIGESKVKALELIDAPYLTSTGPGYRTFKKNGFYRVLVDPPEAGGTVIYTRRLTTGNLLNSSSECWIDNKDGVYAGIAAKDKKPFAKPTTEWRSADGKTLVRWISSNVSHRPHYAYNSAYTSATVADVNAAVPPGLRMQEDGTNDEHSTVKKDTVSGAAVGTDMYSSQLWVNNKAIVLPEGWGGEIVAACVWQEPPPEDPNVTRRKYVKALTVTHSDPSGGQIFWTVSLQVLELNAPDPTMALSTYALHTFTKPVAAFMSPNLFFEFNLSATQALWANVDPGGWGPTIFEPIDPGAGFQLVDCPTIGDTPTLSAIDVTAIVGTSPDTTLFSTIYALGFRGDEMVYLYCRTTISGSPVGIVGSSSQTRVIRVTKESEGLLGGTVLNNVTITTTTTKTGSADADEGSTDFHQLYETTSTGGTSWAYVGGSMRDNLMVFMPYTCGSFTYDRHRDANSSGFVIETHSMTWDGATVAPLKVFFRDRSIDLSFDPTSLTSLRPGLTTDGPAVIPLFLDRTECPPMQWATTLPAKSAFLSFANVPANPADYSTDYNGHAIVAVDTGSDLVLRAIPGSDDFCSFHLMKV
jgi:hypothetical protein